MTKMKKLLAVVLVCVLLICGNSSVFAAENEEVTVDPINLYSSARWYDPHHGWEYRQSISTVSPSNSDILLNAHTDGKPYSGTKVSMWRRTGHSTQIWYSDMQSDGRIALRPRDNPDLALNANRSYVGTVCDLIYSSTNIYDDYACTLTYTNSSVPAKVKISLPARYNHTQTVYLTHYGNQNYCKWQYSTGTSSQYLWECDAPNPAS